METRSRVPTIAVFAALALACTARYDDGTAEVVAQMLANEDLVAHAVANERQAAPPPEPLTIEVHVAAPGRPVTEVEREIAIPLERALGDLPQLMRMHSRSAADRATIVLTLEASADAERSRVLVMERLRAANRSLPDDVIPEIGADLAPPASARVFALSSTIHNSMQLHEVGSRLREALETVPGVAQVELCGGHEARLVVTLDAARLAAHHLALGAMITALRSNLGDQHRPSSGPVAVLGMRDMDELMALVVAPGALPLALRDLASVSAEPGIPECAAARIGGGQVVVGTVRARRGADLEAMDAEIQARLAARTSELPSGFALELSDARPIRFALDLMATADASETLPRASRALAAALGGRPAVVKATTAVQGGMRIDGELLLASTGLSAADLAMLERGLASLPNIRVRARGVADAVGTIDDPSVLRFRIRGDELEVDRRLASEAAALVAVVPGVVHAEAREEQQPSFTLTIRPSVLADLGLARDAVRDTIAAALGGVPVGSMQMQGSRMPVIVRLGSSGDHQAQMAALPGLAISHRGGTVRLEKLVAISSVIEPATITRIDGHRAVIVEVRVGENPAKVALALHQALETSLRLPPGYAVIWDPAASITRPSTRSRR